MKTFYIILVLSSFLGVMFVARDKQKRLDRAYETIGDLSTRLALCRLNPTDTIEVIDTVYFHNVRHETFALPDGVFSEPIGRLVHPSVGSEYHPCVVSFGNTSYVRINGRWLRMGGF